MKPNFDFDRMVKKAKKNSDLPSDGVHIGEQVSLSLQTKPKKKEGVKE
jgi:hypothetical protein